MSKQKLASVTLHTENNYDVRPDSLIMEVADYHQLLEALKAGEPHSVMPYYYHKDNTGSAQAFWYQGPNSVTVFPQRIFQITFHLSDYEIGTL